MRLAKAMIAVFAVAVAAGCATRLEMGPGYYSYDSRAVSSVAVEPVVVRPPEPSVVFVEPAK